MKSTTSFLSATMLVAFITGNAIAQNPSWQWAMSAGGNESETVTSTCSDDDGNFFVAGTFRCPELSFGSSILSGQATYTSYSNTHYIVKLNSSGEVVWSENGENIAFYSMAADKDGNLYASGYYFFNAVLDSYSFSADSTLIVGNLFVKFDPAGDVLWVKESDSSTIFDLSIDAAGDVYAVGGFAGPAYDFEGTMLTGTGTGQVFDIFIAKYDPQGNLQWVKNGGGQNQLTDAHIAVDGSGNAYLAGVFGSPTFSIEGASFYHPTSNGANYNLFVARYDADGNFQWGLGAEGTSNAEVNDIAVNSNGEAYITGVFTGESLNFNTLPQYGNADCNNSFLLHISASGTVLFGEGNGNTNNNDGVCITIDTADNVYVGGWFANTMTVGNITLTSAGALDFYIVKYDPSGNVMNAFSTGTLFDYLTGIGLDENGSLYIAGTISGESFQLGDFTITNHLAESFDILIAKEGIPPATAISPINPAIEFRAYPNPASDVFTVQSNSITPLQFGLYNSQGKQVYQTELLTGTNSLDVADQAKGIYFYKISAGGGHIQTGKLIRQ